MKWTITAQYVLTFHKNFIESYEGTTIPSFFLKLYLKVWMKVQLTQKEWEKFWIISTERGTKFPKRATKLCHTRNRCPRLAICVHYGRFYELLSRKNYVYGMCLFVCLFVLSTMTKVSNKNLKFFARKNLRLTWPEIPPCLQSQLQTPPPNPKNSYHISKVSEP